MCHGVFFTFLTRVMAFSGHATTQRPQAFQSSSRGVY